MSSLRVPERDELHERNLEYTIKELQKQIKEHETELNRLRANAPRNPEVSPAATLSIMKTAFEDLAKSEPYLPFSDSVLPALLALKKTHQTIQESRAYLESQQPVLTDAKKQLEASKADLEDQKALSEAISTRIQGLKSDLDSEMEMDPDEIARERINKLAQRKKQYDQERIRLLKLLRSFVDDKLAPMLAAEQLGGPVVGDLMDVDDDLAGGFTAHGKPKKTKGGAADEDRRQRRLDEIWGAVTEEGSRKGKGKGKEKEWDEATAAGKEMKELVMLLLNHLTKAGGDNSSAYVGVERESAAARFLVRSKVAQLHPRDATRLRLVDFGREIDD